MATDLYTVEFYSIASLVVLSSAVCILCEYRIMDKKRTVWTASQSVILLRAAIERHELFLVS